MPEMQAANQDPNVHVDSTTCPGVIIAISRVKYQLGWKKERGGIQLNKGLAALAFDRIHLVLKITAQLSLNCFFFCFLCLVLFTFVGSFPSSAFKG